VALQIDADRRAAAFIDEPMLASVSVMTTFPADHRRVSGRLHRIPYRFPL
jgi:hypothetical protein